MWRDRYMKTGALALGAALVVLTAGSLGKPHSLADPGKPKNLKATADGPYAVDLDWKPVGGAEGYYVYRDGNRVAETERSNYRDEGLQPATTYVYRVSAADDDGDESKLSDPASATTLSVEEGPPPPENVTATEAGSTRILVTWSPPSGSESVVAGYNVYREGDLVGFVVATAFTDTGLSPETTYRYTVASVDDRGVEGARSEEASATTAAPQDLIPPASPTGLRVVGS
jgi:chitodextrinase